MQGVKSNPETNQCRRALNAVSKAAAPGDASLLPFWQMIGRGTRLCPDLFGPGDDKRDFRVFDFCFNFDFFRENRQGIDAGDAAPLGNRLFRARVQLLGHVQTTPDLDPDAALAGSLSTQLQREVAAMNRGNFIVRMHLEAVNRFQRPQAWDVTAADSTRYSGRRYTDSVRIAASSSANRFPR